MAYLAERIQLAQRRLLTRGLPGANPGVNGFTPEFNEFKQLVLVRRVKSYRS